MSDGTVYPPLGTYEGQGKNEFKFNENTSISYIGAAYHKTEGG